MKVFKLLSKADTSDERNKITNVLANAHEDWSVTLDKVSEQVVIEAERKEFHPNGATATALALDHPNKSGWEVLAPGNSKDRWEAIYESGVVAAEVLADLTHIFEARRRIKHERPNSQVTQAYYSIEGEFLEALKQKEKITSSRME